MVEAAVAAPLEEAGPPPAWPWGEAAGCCQAPRGAGRGAGAVLYMASRALMRLCFGAGAG